MWLNLCVGGYNYFLLFFSIGVGHYYFKGAVEDSATAEISRSQVGTTIHKDMWKMYTSSTFFREKVNDHDIETNAFLDHQFHIPFIEFFLPKYYL